MKRYLVAAGLSALGTRRHRGHDLGGDAPGARPRRAAGSRRHRARRGAGRPCCRTGGSRCYAERRARAACGAAGRAGTAAARGGGRRGSVADAGRGLPCRQVSRTRRRAIAEILASDNLSKRVSSIKASQATVQVRMIYKVSDDRLARMRTTAFGPALAPQEPGLSVETTLDGWVLRRLHQDLAFFEDLEN